jgi:ABC-type phosphate/phosphonate transport system permease subunit
MSISLARTNHRAASVGMAISLGLVGHAGLGERLGRNARFSSIGNALAAAGMGWPG